jgi:hypothetical protein
VIRSAVAWSLSFRLVVIPGGGGAGRLRRPPAPRHAGRRIPRRGERRHLGPALVLRGALERLSPILMTALATGLALVPLLAYGDIPGHEVELPMAVVIVGGLVTSTLLNLFVVPLLYLRFGRPRAVVAS